MRKLLTLTGVLVLFTFLCHAQTIKVSGTVNNEQNIPVRDVSVTEKGTGNGTLTDVNGHFSLNVKPNATLVISLVGYIPLEAAAKDPVNVSLQLSSENLNEVVVTALGIRRDKKALGYSVATVNQEQLQQRPEGDIARVLNGKVAGLNINNSSGLSGSGTNIVVRAISSINGNSQPLFIVDGVPFNSSTNTNADFRQGNQTSSRFLDLDPNNIASVNVLKGLSATVLYGEDGRNGVIVVTTKNGFNSSTPTKKKTEITVSQSYFASEAHLPTYQKEWGGGFEQATGVVFYSNWGGAITNPPAVVKHPYDKPIYATAFPQYQGAPYDYKFYPSVKDFFRTGLVSTTSVNVSGGTGKVSFNANYGYIDDKGITPGNSLIRQNFGLGGVAQLTNHFTVSGSFNYATSSVKSPPTATSFGSGSANGPAIFGDVMYTPVTIDLMHLPYENPLDGSSVYYRNNNSIQNPRWTVAHSHANDDVNRFFGNIQMKYSFTPNINLLYRVGVDQYSETQIYAQDKGGIPGAPFQTGIYRTSNGINRIWDHTIFVNFNKNLSSDWSLNVDAGVNSKETKYSQNGITSTQQVVFGLMDHSNFDTHSSTSEGGFDLDYKNDLLQLGAFLQAGVGYRDFLYLNIGGRNSWVSTVEKENRSIFYPSASASFIPTSAISSLKGNRTLNYLKVRAGYATSADFPSPYNTRASLNVNTRSFLTTDAAPVNTLSISNTLPNPLLKPELLREVEAGIEGNFFNRRVDMDFTVYRRISKDQLLNKQLDPSTGYTNQTVNAGDVTNRGIELSLGYTIVRSKNWNWRVQGLYNINKSKVSNIPAALGSINIAGFSNLGTFAINGEPLGILQGVYVNRYQKKDASGNNVDDPLNGTKIVNTLGDYSKSGEIGIIGDPNPKYKMTGISTLGFKGISLSMQWEFTKGGDIYANTPSTLIGRGVVGNGKVDRNNLIVLPGVQADGTTNTVQTTFSDAYFDNSVAGGGADELSVFDGTVVRLREVSLSYDLPQSLIRKTPFGSLSISISGQNLWYYAPNFPDDTNFDPEVNGLGVSNGRGLEFFSGPSAARFGGSVRITF